MVDKFGEGRVFVAGGQHSRHEHHLMILTDPQTQRTYIVQLVARYVGLYQEGNSVELTRLRLGSELWGSRFSESYILILLAFL